MKFTNSRNAWLEDQVEQGEIARREKLIEYFHWSYCHESKVPEGIRKEVYAQINHQTEDASWILLTDQQVKDMTDCLGNIMKFTIIDCFSSHPQEAHAFRRGLLTKQDYQAVQNNLIHWHAIEVPLHLIEKIIKNNSMLQKELYGCGKDGHVETYGREQFINCLVEEIMKGTVPSDIKKRHCPTKWTWPVFGDSKEYQKEFYKNFIELAKKVDVIFV